MDTYPRVLLLGAEDFVGPGDLSSLRLLALLLLRVDGRGGVRSRGGVQELTIDFVEFLAQVRDLLVMSGLLGAVEPLDRRRLELGLVALLVGLVGLLDDRVHLPLLGPQLLLDLPADLLERHALAPQAVDLLAQLLVSGDALVELDERLVELVLEETDLLLDEPPAVGGGVDAAHLAPPPPDVLAQGRDLLLHARGLGPFAIDESGVALELLIQPVELGLFIAADGLGHPPHLQPRDVRLELLILGAELAQRRLLPLEHELPAVPIMRVSAQEWLGQCVSR